MLLLAVLASFALEAPASVQQPSLAEIFPTPKEALVIPVDRNGREKSMSLDELLTEFSRVTGITMQCSKETTGMLRSIPTGLNQTITVPPSEVYRIVETILIANDVAVIHLSDREPRIWLAQPVNSGGGRGGPMIRNDARLVAEHELEAWAAHPATLVTTMVDLPNVDVRTLSNSMRTMFTDANTQQVVPVGASSLILTGFAPNVANLVKVLHAIDDAKASLPARESDPAARPAPEKK